MACMIEFNLQDPATDLEKPSHPLHKAWYKSLKLLRDTGLETPGNTGYKQKISEYSYVCMDQEHPEQVVYLYPRCSDEKFTAIEAMCTSETSQRIISPLLKAPLSAASISRFTKEIGLIHPNAFRGASKCLEFMTFYNPERPMMLYPFLEPHWPGGSCAGLSHVPVRSFSYVHLDSPNEDRILFCCIEWKSLSDRAALYADPLLRKRMKAANASYRAPFLQVLGKTEEDLTWEEDLSIFFDSTGAKIIQSRFVTATLVTDDYLGLNEKKRRPCEIM